MKKYAFPLIFILVYVSLFFTLPDVAERASYTMVDYLKEMALILPPVFILMGLIEVWVPKEKIEGWLGQQSGLKGTLLSILLGTLPTGPLYVAFPIALTLLRKGARVRNVVVFLGVWAAVKIPQLLVEIEFLGFNFTMMRIVLTLSTVLISGWLIELFYSARGKPLHWTQNQE